MLSLFLYAEINIVGSAVLLMMLTSQNKRSFKNTPVDQQLFNGVMALNLVIFLFDTGMWLSDNSPLWGMRTINYLSTILYYFFTPWICLLWLMYTDFKINESWADLLRRSRYYVIPALACTVLTLCSPFTGWFFVISGDNHYSRGPWLMVLTLVTFSYLAAACSIALGDTLKNGWRQNNGLNPLLVVYPLGIMAAAILQLRRFGLSVIWVCAMLGCASIYINIQNAELLTDHLTGLYNRRRLDQHLRRRIKAQYKKRLLFAMVLDVDDFKKINDCFGHIAGDYALMRIAQLLRKSCISGEDFIARWGGDEFIIVGERTGADEIRALMKAIKENILGYNQSGHAPYTLMLSMGYAVFKAGDTEDSFLAAADKAMYRSKLKNKAAATPHNEQARP